MYTKHPTKGKNEAAVAHPIDLVDDGRGHVARQKKIGVHRVHRAPFDGAPRRHQALADHLAAEDALSPEIGGLAAEEVDFELFQIELRDQAL